MCNDNMVFRDIVAGWPCSVHDSRVLRNSSLFVAAAAKFPGDTHILGDGGYPLKRFRCSPSSSIAWLVFLYFVMYFKMGSNSLPANVQHQDINRNMHQQLAFILI